MKIPFKYSKKKGKEGDLELAFNRAVAISETVEKRIKIKRKRTKTFSLNDPIRDIFEWALEEFLEGDLLLCPDESSKEEGASYL